MSLIRRGNERNNEIQRIISGAIEVLRANGITAAQAYSYITHSGESIWNWLQELSRNNDRAAQAYVEWLDESGEMGNLAEMTRDRSRLDRHHQGRERIEPPAKRPALTNTPATTQATMSDDNEAGVGVEEGNEQQVTKPRHVWRRFPNTETAALKWIWTAYWEDSVFTANSVNATSLPFTQPFDQQKWKSTTNLLTTGGGALTQAMDTLGEANEGLPNPGVLTGTPPVVGGAALTGAPNNSRGGHDFQHPVLMQFRMTSPYSIVKQVIGRNLNQITNTAAQPAWIEFFDTKYEYYHVIDCEWQLDLHFGRVFTFSSGTPNVYRDTDPKDFGYYIFWKYTNQDDPPTAYSYSSTLVANIANLASGLALDSSSIGTTGVITTPGGLKNQGATAATGTAIVNLTPDDYMRMGGWKTRHVMRSDITDGKVTIRGKYRFGQSKMDIKTLLHNDAAGPQANPTAEGWNTVGSTPQFPENLSIIIVQDNAMHAGNEAQGVYTQFSHRMQTEHLTQFKDLRYPYKFPTPANTQLPGTNNFNTDAVFFSKGAAYS